MAQTLSGTLPVLVSLAYYLSEPEQQAEATP